MKDLKSQLVVEERLYHFAYIHNTDKDTGMRKLFNTLSTMVLSSGEEVYHCWREKSFFVGKNVKGRK